MHRVFFDPPCKEDQMIDWRAYVLIGLMVGLSFNARAAAPGPQPPATNEVAIVGAKMYSSPEAPAVDDSVVVIRNGRISLAGPRSNTPVPPKARVIDAHGAVLTAGFWNSHIHLMIPDLLDATTAKADTLQAALQAMLTRWGFTSVFDLASSTEN